MNDESTTPTTDVEAESMNPDETFVCGQRPGAVLMEDKQGVCVFVPCEPTGHERAGEAYEMARKVPR